MAVTGLDHVNIQTDRLQDTCAFFVDVLGFEVGWRPDFSFGGAWLYAGGGALVHLVEVAAAAQPSRGSALDHFAFAIDDFEGTLKRVEASGVRHRAQGVAGTPIRQIFITELNGVTLELNCRG